MCFSWWGFLRRRSSSPESILPPTATPGEKYVQIYFNQKPATPSAEQHYKPEFTEKTWGLFQLGSAENKINIPQLLSWTWSEVTADVSSCWVLKYKYKIENCRKRVTFSCPSSEGGNKTKLTSRERLWSSSLKGDAWPAATFLTEPDRAVWLDEALLTNRIHKLQSEAVFCSLTSRVVRTILATEEK